MLGGKIMTKIKDGGTINHIEQRNANHISGTKIKTTVNVTRKDTVNKKMIISKISKLAKKTAKLSWI